MTTLDDLLRLSETMEPEKPEMLLQYAHELTKASADTSAPVPSSVENTSQPRKRTNNLLENPSCIYCGSGAVKKDGIQHNKQRYRCKTCGRTFAQGFRDRDETVRLVCERLLALDENDVSNKISELSSKDLWDK